MHRYLKLLRKAEQVGENAEQRAPDSGDVGYIFLIAHPDSAALPLLKWMLDNLYAHLVKGGIQLHLHAASPDSAKQRAYARAVTQYLLSEVPHLCLIGQERI